MNTMQVEILTRDNGGPLAVACPQGGLLSEAGIGGGDTERAAVIQAINSYYNRVELREQANTVSVPEPLPQSTIVSRMATVAISPYEIRRLLERAISTAAKVLITGRKVNGDAYEDREVRPLSVAEGDMSLPSSLRTVYLNCDTSEGMRSFRLEGIERVELLYPDTSA